MVIYLRVTDGIQSFSVAVLKWFVPSALLPRTKRPPRRLNINRLMHTLLHLNTLARETRRRRGRRARALPPQMPDIFFERDIAAQAAAPIVAPEQPAKETFPRRPRDLRLDGRHVCAFERRALGAVDCGSGVDCRRGGVAAAGAGAAGGAFDGGGEGLQDGWPDALDEVFESGRAGADDGDIELDGGPDAEERRVPGYVGVDGHGVDVD